MPAVRNCIAVLRALGSTTSPVSAGALARTLQMPRSSTYQLLQVLVEEGLVVHVDEVAGYTLGEGASELGSAYSRRSALANVAQPLLSKLARTVGADATLSIIWGTHVVCLVRERPQHPSSRLNRTVVPLLQPGYRTSAGRALLAALPHSEAQAWCRAVDALAPTGHGLRDASTLSATLIQDSRRGWVVETDSLGGSVAAAAYDRNARPIAAIAVALPASRDTDRVDEIAREVVRSADALTRRLGGRRPARDAGAGS